MGGEVYPLIDTLGDEMSIPNMLEELNLKPIVIHSVEEVWKSNQGNGLAVFRWRLLVPFLEAQPGCIRTLGRALG
jgi:hypothetical protein